MVEPERIAECIDAAHDLLLVDGRSTGWGAEGGPRCVLHALSNASVALYGEHSTASAAHDVLNRMVGAERINIVNWNFDATDDEMLDFLRHASKALREEAGQQQ